ncbi:amine oxidase, flavin-containing superfamily [Karstenula rhodostoma CBS 690.94]|uniref:Amine oxidase, flavin-containing superfamily n=1 Tax=Karstenula rhodostoma CBS 690.94 TaxID=1392251 RepID=A0A9P4PPA7_9PLEO|nr:amine oxidase, flavin-containing superfamily [Karstenula rhodostoma CBS 690.94]
MRSQAFLLSSWAALTLAAPSTTNNYGHFDPSDIIERDVAIIGGGAAGTHASISLKDKGKSVIVIEKKDRIGGHAETYIDSATGTPIDMGVIIFHNLTIVRDYFARFDVPLITLGSDAGSGSDSVSANYDLRTGKEVNITSPSQADTAAAFANYTQFLSKYPRLNDGMFLPSPVPDDLVLPFGKFAKKYGIEAALPTMYNYNPGLGDILTVPMIENQRVWGQSLVQQLSGGFLTTAHHNTSELYSKAQAELLAASSLLLSSQVLDSERCDDGITLVVSTPKGRKLVRARKLLITIPPRLNFLAPFDLSKNERSIFAKLIDAGYYTSILRNTGLPDNLSIANARPDTPYNLPSLPSVYSIGSTDVPGLKLAYYGTPRSPATFPLPDKKVKADILAAFKTLQRANPGAFNQTEPEFVAYSSHAPFYLQARPEDTKKGFYGEMYKLQGGRSTYWTGASWRAQDSSDIWRFTEEEVLPGLVEGL